MIIKLTSEEKNDYTEQNLSIRKDIFQDWSMEWNCLGQWFWCNYFKLPAKHPALQIVCLKFPS